MSHSARAEAQIPPHAEVIVVLDFGSQYAQLIARRVREAGAFSLLAAPDTPIERLAALDQELQDARPDQDAMFGEFITQLEGVLREEQKPSLAAFRDRVGTGRKLAIHILEFFDKVGYTRRIGDERVIRNAEMWR